MEETSSSIQLFLCPKGYCSPCDILVLLCCHPFVCHGSWCQHSCMGAGLYSHCNYMYERHQKSWVCIIQQCTTFHLPSSVNVAIFRLYCVIYQVSPSDALLDSVRECYVHAPHACCRNRFTWDCTCKWLGSHWEGRRSCEGWPGCSTPWTSEANRMRWEVTEFTFQCWRNKGWILLLV